MDTLSFVIVGHVDHGPNGNLGRLDWVICGGESGPHARPTHPRWVRALRDQCASSKVPFMFKQWGRWAPVEWYYSDEYTGVVALRDPRGGIAGGSCGSTDGEGTWWLPVGKDHAGRELDGREHLQRPSTVGSIA